MYDSNRPFYKAEGVLGGCWGNEPLRRNWIPSSVPFRRCLSPTKGMDVRSVADQMVLLLGVRSGIIGDRHRRTWEALASLGA